VYETNLSGLVQLRRDHAAKIELFTTSEQGPPRREGFDPATMIPNPMQMFGRDKE
jgi:hypothetical protein